jgi:YVTN family beta-propeller protein
MEAKVMAKLVSVRVAFLTVFVTLLALLTTTAQPPTATFANFEAAQTNPIRLSADGTRLFAVNTPNSSLSVFDVATTPGTPTLIAQIPVGLGPVSVNPLTDDVAWVVNQVSNSVSIVSVSQGIVTNTIGNLQSEPMDVVFAGVNQAYVSISRSNQIAVFDTSTLAPIATIPVFGDNPRALAVSPDGSTVYAAFALAGNGTTIIPKNLAPPQCGTAGAAACDPPFNTVLPPPPQVGLIVAATNPKWSSFIKFTMPDNGVVAINTGPSPSIAGYYSNVGTVNLGLAVNPANGDLFVANTAALNITCTVRNSPVVCFEPNLQGHWVNNQITHIQVATGQVTPVDLNPNINYGILPNPVALSTALAQPTSVVFDPSGNFMYVASFGTDRVAQVDTNGNVQGFVEVGPPSEVGSGVDPANKVGPRGLALNAGAQTLYCLNRISDTISIINTSTQAVTSIPVGTDPEPATIVNGRGFLYDAKLSGNGTGSCASCHVDGDMDHLAWNLGNPAGTMTETQQNGTTFKFHPMKGPMTTQTMRGLINLSPYHWRGDKPNFAAFDSTFDDLMGGSEIPVAEMTAYTNFVNTILYLPNPNENLNRTPPTSLDSGNAVTGQTDFLTLVLSQPGTGGPATTCNACHTADPGPGSNCLIQATQPQPMLNAQLRNIYQKLLFTSTASSTIDGFGLIHDGSTSTLQDFFSIPSFAGYTNLEKIDMGAYLLSFDTGTAPAVGHTITLTATTVNGLSAQTVWATLQSQAQAGNNDLIARGTIQHQLHGLLYQPLTKNYLSDTGVLYTQAQLTTFILAGDTLSFMGVYPGTGTT